MNEYEYEINGYDRDRFARVSNADGIVSISLNDSWTGRKLLEAFGHTAMARVTPNELEVCPRYSLSMYCYHFIIKLTFFGIGIKMRFFEKKKKIEQWKLEEFVYISVSPFSY